MHKQPYLLVISGPTASGKTALSIALAQHYRTVILSADSRQFFREMQIGTAKPSAAERTLVPHYFIDSQSIFDNYSVGDYERDALALLEQCFTEQELVILTGGSGLYIQALCEGLDHFPPTPPATRQALLELYEQKGLSALQEELRRADPRYYEEVDLQNPQRLIRALEVCRSTGKPFSEFRRKRPASRPFVPIYLQLQWPRQELYQRINSRVDHMMTAGLLDEVKQLLPHQQLNALQTVGYQELFQYLRGECSLEEAVELIKRNTRRYAKRQLTWNRRHGHWKHFHPEETEKAKAYIDHVVKTGRQVFYQKAETQTKESILGWKDQTTQEGYLTIEQNKKGVHIRLAKSPQPTAKELQWLLHEVKRRYAEEELFFDLPEDFVQLL